MIHPPGECEILFDEPFIFPFVQIITDPPPDNTTMSVLERLCSLGMTALNTGVLHASQNNATPVLLDGRLLGYISKQHVRNAARQLRLCKAKNIHNVCQTCDYCIGRGMVDSILIYDE